jgi:hypothetical protein
MKKQQKLDNSKLFFGFLSGIVVGVLVALFRAPRIRNRHANDHSGEIIMPDAEKFDVSMERGKHAARRRRAELGLKTE